MRWVRVTRGDSAANALANRHYSRRRRGRTVGPPARVAILRTPAGDALWVASSSDHERDTPTFRRAWVCNYFRNESPHLASELILEALAATVDVLGHPPDDGIVTYVDPARVRPNRRPGRVFERAGFERTRLVTSGRGHGRPDLLEFHRRLEDVEPVPPLELALTFAV